MLAWVNWLLQHLYPMYGPQVEGFQNRRIQPDRKLLLWIPSVLWLAATTSRIMAAYVVVTASPGGKHFFKHLAVIWGKIRYTYRRRLPSSGSALKSNATYFSRAEFRTFSRIKTIFPIRLPGYHQAKQPKAGQSWKAKTMDSNLVMLLYKRCFFIYANRFFNLKSGCFQSAFGIGKGLFPWFVQIHGGMFGMIRTRFFLRWLQFSSFWNPGDASNVWLPLPCIVESTT